MLCEGAVFIPAGTLVEFCMVVSSNLVDGIPPVKTFVLPFVFRDGPITTPDATPVATPALSPMLMGIVVPRLCAGIMEIMCFIEQVGGRAMGLWAVLG